MTVMAMPLVSPTAPGARLAVIASMLLFGSWLTLGAGSLAQAAEPEKYVLGTSTDEKVFTGVMERLVYGEAFRRLGVRLEVVVAPLKRLEAMLERGEIDGEMMRGPTYGVLHPNLLTVDMPVARVNYALYALKPVAGLSSLDDLRGGKFRGAYRRGVVYCENALAPILRKQMLDAVTTAKQAIDMMANGHADFFCEVSLGMLNYEYEAGLSKPSKPLKLFDISGAVPNNGYLHPKHKAFAAKLDATLKQMEAEGLFEKYRLETMARLQRP